MLDVGSEPGFVSLSLSGGVGPTGIIYAVDRADEALAYPERLQKDRGVANIKTIVADAARLDLPAVHVDAALIAMVLHHTDNPASVAPLQVKMWCEAAGLATLNERRQSLEHYMVLAQRPL